MAIINQQLGQEFQKRLKTLPEDIQYALTAVASVDTIFAIGKKHGLMVDQIGKMADEIWKVMLGLANPKDFIRNLASALSIESEKASAIASDVNAQMFQMVRESLRKIYDSSTPLVPPINPPSPPYSKGGDKKEGELSKSQVPSMIYPQDRFEEPFGKELTKEDAASSTYHVSRETEEKKEEELLYPEKMKEISREPASPAGGPAIGGYKSRDPYREPVE